MGKTGTEKLSEAIMTFLSFLILRKNILKLIRHHTKTTDPGNSGNK